LVLLSFFIFELKICTCQNDAQTQQTDGRTWTIMRPIDTAA